MLYFLPPRLVVLLHYLENRKLGICVCSLAACCVWPKNTENTFIISHGHSSAAYHCQNDGLYAPDRTGAQHPAACYSHTRRLPSLSRCRSLWELLFIMPRVKFNRKYCWYGLLSQQMLDAIKCVVSDNFVFQQDSALVHFAFNAAVLLQCIKRLASFLLSYGPVRVQSLTPLTTRFRESQSCMSMSCK